MTKNHPPNEDTCHDIGISGGCGCDCPVFLDGRCEEDHEMLQNLIETYIELKSKNKELTRELRLERNKYTRFDILDIG